jgi:Flp pilus assembly protein TadD
MLAPNDPPFTLYRGNLGSYLLAAGQVEAALGELRHAEQLSPDESRDESGVSRALLFLGRASETPEANWASTSDPSVSGRSARTRLR